MEALGRGCVKTRSTAVSRNIDLSERAVFDYFRVWKGERTPENDMDVRFHTASAARGLKSRALEHWAFFDQPSPWHPRPCTNTSCHVLRCRVLRDRQSPLPIRRYTLNSALSSRSSQRSNFGTLQGCSLSRHRLCMDAPTVCRSYVARRTDALAALRYGSSHPSRSGRQY